MNQGAISSLVESMSEHFSLNPPGGNRWMVRYNEKEDAIDLIMEVYPPDLSQPLFPPERLEAISFTVPQNLKDEMARLATEFRVILEVPMGPVGIPTGRIRRPRGG